MKTNFLFLLCFSLILISCSEEETLIFEKKLIKSFENTYDSNKIMFFYNSDSTLNKIEHFWLDTIRATYDFSYTGDNHIISIESYTSEYLYSGFGFFKIPYHNSIIPYFNDLNMVDSVFVFDKETNLIKEKNYFYYNSNNNIVKIEKHNLIENFNNIWNLAFLNSNIETINTRNFNYDSMTNPFYSLGLPIFDVPYLSIVEILSTNNVIFSECQEYGIIDYSITYKNNYPIKKTHKNDSSVFIYEYY